MTTGPLPFLQSATAAANAARSSSRCASCRVRVASAAVALDGGIDRQMHRLAPFARPAQIVDANRRSRQSRQKAAQALRRVLLEGLGELFGRHLTAGEDQYRVRERSLTNVGDKRVKCSLVFWLESSKADDE